MHISNKIPLKFKLQNVNKSDFMQITLISADLWDDCLNPSSIMTK